MKIAMKLFAIVCMLLLVSPALHGQESADSTQATTQQAPHPAQPLLDKALAAFKESDATAAMELFQSAYNQHPDLPPGEVMFARLAYATGNRSSGRTALERAAENHGNDPEVWNMLAELAIGEGRIAEAEVLFEKALELSDSYDRNETRKNKLTATAHAGLAAIYERRQNWAAAKPHLRAWIELDQRNEAAWNRLAAAHFQLEDYEFAKQTLQNLSTFSKSGVLPEVAMGRMYQADGKHELAKKAMLNAKQAGQDDAQTQIAVGLWAMAAGEQQLMQQCVNRAKELVPDSPAVNAMLGTVKRFEGDSVGAEIIFAELHQQNPASFDATNGLALSLLSQDSPEKHQLALRHAEVLLKSNSNTKTQKGRAAVATYAWALFRIGKTKEAEQVIRKAILGGEFSPEVGYFAAAIFESVGELDAAKQFAQAALNSSVAFPEEADARALLTRLSK
ncbi:tetratricopeptide repeat protein [Crateriforma conspicua]|uniref:Tetratricopeptide repeat protein n=1 Tax=Crateriforma conspicua TaxID=2527996 RepID=A0A5C5XZY5_9PLAN|nr:tetratricopeptide repeat protein [Crateriforma conspicua]TWT69016.1 tetratricopeptide repeat protein [Crateriforma conspicua]